MTLRALTIRQPWAAAIAHGAKRTENRTWSAPGKHIGTRILIHAGAAYDPMGRFIIDRVALDSWPDTRQAVIAVATLADCHQAAGGCCTPWGEPNTWHWGLASVAALAEPIPCKGRLGLWTPPADVIEALPGGWTA